MSRNNEEQSGNQTCLLDKATWWILGFTMVYMVAQIIRALV